MAKLTTITDRETGETRYPITSTKAVFDERGVDLDTLLAEQKRETTNTLKGYATATQLTEGLATKQGNLSTTTDLQINDNVLGLSKEFKDSKLDRSVWDEKNEQFSVHGKYTSIIDGSVGISNNYATTPLMAINRDYDIIARVRISTNNTSAISFYDGAGKFIVAINNRLSTNIPDVEIEIESSNAWAIFRIPSQSIPQNATYFQCGSLYAHTGAYYSNGPGPTFESREGAFSEAMAASKLALFIDLWNSACGKWGQYNPQTGYFELNGLTDITYEEAVKIYAKWNNTAFLNSAYVSLNIRTNIPSAYFDGFNMTNAFLFCSNIETIRLGEDASLYRGNFSSTFRRAEKLRRVFGIMNCPIFDDLTFEHCGGLEEIRISCANGYNIPTINLQWSPKISLYSLNYYVTHKYQGSATVITVHPDIYAKLTGDTTNAAAAELTQEELAQWAQVLVDAAEKNIIFATT